MMTGNVNTSVLPEPVKAIPIMSRPDRLLGEERPEDPVQENAGNESPGGHLGTAPPHHHPLQGPQVYTHMVGMPWI